MFQQLTKQLTCDPGNWIWASQSHYIPAWWVMWCDTITKDLLSIPAKKYVHNECHICLELLTWSPLLCSSAGEIYDAGWTTHTYPGMLQQSTRIQRTEECLICSLSGQRTVAAKRIHQTQSVHVKSGRCCWSCFTNFNALNHQSKVTKTYNTFVLDDKIDGSERMNLNQE